MTRILPEPGELWEYQNGDDEPRHFLILERRPNPRWEANDAESAIYFTLEIEYGNTRDVQFGYYLESFRRLA